MRSILYIAMAITFINATFVTAVAVYEAVDGEYLKAVVMALFDTSVTVLLLIKIAETWMQSI